MSENNSDPIIQVRGLSKSFGQKLVVDNVNLEIRKGEVMGFLGPNGSGKTTTIRMLCGLLKADAGEGTCLGYDILTQSDNIKKQVGYMTQRFSLYSELTIEENLNFIARTFGVEEYKIKVKQMLENFGLHTYKNQLAGELSGGWKQRLALACCLIHDPQILLLDEPTSGVDPMARREFWDRIHALSEQGVTTFVSTHYMDEAERCTRIAYLAYGKLLVTGSVDDVIKETGIITWEVSGPVTTSLLQILSRMQGVVQSALVGGVIHICGYDKPLIEKELTRYSSKHALEWKIVKTNLEDAFISLVNKSQEPILD